MTIVAFNGHLSVTISEFIGTKMPSSAIDKIVDKTTKNSPIFKEFGTIGQIMPR